VLQRGSKAGGKPVKRERKKHAPRGLELRSGKQRSSPFVAFLSWNGRRLKGGTRRRIWVGTAKDDFLRIGGGGRESDIETGSVVT